MGAWQSIAEQPSEDTLQFGADIIQTIIERLPSTVIIKNANLVNKKWREIGQRINASNFKSQRLPPRRGIPNVF